MPGQASYPAIRTPSDVQLSIGKLSSFTAPYAGDHPHQTFPIKGEACSTDPVRSQLGLEEGLDPHFCLSDLSRPTSTLTWRSFTWFWIDSLAFCAALPTFEAARSAALPRL